MALIKLFRPPEYLIPDERSEIALKFDTTVIKWRQTVRRLARRKGQRRGWQPKIGPAEATL